MTQKEQQRAAEQFAETWKGRGDEKSETQIFWIGLLRQVFGVENAEAFIQFEKRVMLDHKSFIDAYIENTLVLIEQKSIDIDLRKAYKQSDGKTLTPFGQAQRYDSKLKRSARARFIIICNFKTFLVYDMENPQSEPWEILLENLGKEYDRLSFLVDERNIHLEREEELSKEAGHLVGLLYDALAAQYSNMDDPVNQRSLNVLCVRLVFCLYAEDANLFGQKNAFHDYMRTFKKENFREGLKGLFKILDMDEGERKTNDDYIYAKDSLKAFPYVNGGLFADENITIPKFTDEIIELLLEECSAKFDWSDISPTIFGAVFESTLNPETRRSGGMHYTSIENIHKVIDPLFLDSLKEEFSKIKKTMTEKERVSKLMEFQKKLASLKFLDPACGSGNFLTESYITLRRLENQIINLLYKGKDGKMEKLLNSDILIKVSLNQFYGIEINDFAVSVAKAALWIAESQMTNETEKLIDCDIKFFPLKDYAQIVEGNALELDWSTLKANANIGTLFDEEKELSDTPPHTSIQYDYIMGNPPFVGAKLTTEKQRKEKIKVFGSDEFGKLDYVACWYKKAFDFIQKEKNIRTVCAFVSTNSVCQGEQVSLLWEPLVKNGLIINFAYRTFRWDSESFLKAHVHCIIVGFSLYNNSSKFIFSEDGTKNKVKNINAYLIEAPNIFFYKRLKPICKVSEMTKGSQLIDGGNFVFKTDEKNRFIDKYPESEPYFYEYINADSFLNQREEKWCLCLKDCPPKIINNCKGLKDVVKKVYEFRSTSEAESTKKIADRPSEFFITNIPKGNSVLVPVVSSERRKYVPIGFIRDKIIYTNATNYIDNATLYEFGILISVVHMSWMRALCGRLKSDYRYSKDIIYNNFPWCSPSREQKEKIEKTARTILDARENEMKKMTGTSLADLYDKDLMPSPLRKAHNENDKAVMQAYGFDLKMSEAEIVSKLMEIYTQITQTTA